MNTHTSKRKMGIMLAAVLIILAALGTAAAATNLFGILDYASQGKNGPKPLGDAEKLIQHSSEDVWTCENGTVQVRETIYTGKTYSILLHTSFETMFPEWRILNAEASVDDLDYSTAEDGLDFMLGGVVEGDAPQTLEVEIEVPIYRDGKVLQPLTIQVSLELQGGETASLRPMNTSESWTLLSATWTNNPYKASIEVIFQCDRAKDYDMGVDIVLLDAQGNRIESGTGIFMEPVELKNGETAYKSCQEVQSLARLPEKIILQPKVIGEDVWLDRIECEIIAE